MRGRSIPIGWSFTPMRKERRTSVVSDLDAFKRKAETQQAKLDAGHAGPICRHVVERDEVVRLRLVGGGITNCVKCGVALPISKTIREMPDGSQL